jgi:hypothetical protein
VSDAEGLNAQGEPVILIERRGRVMVATLNRPEVRNAVNRAMWIGLGRALEECERDSDVWAFVLTGSGDASFCAGADLKALSRGEPILPDDPAEVAWGFAGYVRHVISKPTIGERLGDCCRQCRLRPPRGEARHLRRCGWRISTASPVAPESRDGDDHDR